MATTEVTVIPPQIIDVEFVVEGTSDYIANRMDIDAIREWRDTKERKKMAKPKKVRPEPEVEAAKGVYWYENGSGPTPSILGAAFKRAMMDAPRFIESMTLVGAKGPFQIAAEFIPIEFDEQILREDWVNEPPGPRGSPQIRYRYAFRGWKCIVPVRFDGNILSVELIANMLSVAGFHVGVGAWRPEKGGSFGTFIVSGSN